MTRLFPPAIRPLAVGVSLAVGLVACGEPADDSITPRTGDPAAEASSLTIEVPYVTNRGRDDEASAGDVYNGDRGEAHVGRCEARFTPIQALDGLASRVPFYVPSEARRVVVAEREAPAAFRRRLDAAVGDGNGASLVVFVHGYSNSFTRTCRMAAEMQRLLDDRATVLMFSWPSDANPAEYVSDQADLEWSVPLLASTLREFADRLGASRVQLLAHSLGSRGVIQALLRLRAEGPPFPRFGRLVFLAPDYDAMSFRDLLPLMAPLTAGVTLYASASDAPLRVSEELNGHPRLGQAGDHLTVMAGMETIDVTSAGRYQLLGHEYFYYHPRVAADLVALLTRGAGADDRPGLRRRRDEAGVAYWEFEAADREEPKRP